MIYGSIVLKNVHVLKYSWSHFFQSENLNRRLIIINFALSHYFLFLLNYTTANIIWMQRYWPSIQTFFGFARWLNYKTSAGGKKCNLGQREHTKQNVNMTFVAHELINLWNICNHSRLTWLDVMNTASRSMMLYGTATIQLHKESCTTNIAQSDDSSSSLNIPRCSLCVLLDIVFFSLELPYNGWNVI